MTDSVDNKLGIQKNRIYRGKNCKRSMFKHLQFLLFVCEKFGKNVMYNKKYRKSVKTYCKEKVEKYMREVV